MSCTNCDACWCVILGNGATSAVGTGGATAAAVGAASATGNGLAIRRSSAGCFCATYAANVFSSGICLCLPFDTCGADTSDEAIAAAGATTGCRAFGALGALGASEAAVAATGCCTFGASGALCTKGAAAATAAMCFFTMSGQPGVFNRRLSAGLRMSNTDNEPLMPFFVFLPICIAPWLEWIPVD